MLENTARSWYDAGYVNLRRRYSNGLEPACELHLGEEPERRARFPLAHVRGGDSAEQQRTSQPEKGPACDIRHRFALSAVYDIAGAEAQAAGRGALTRDWRLSAIYQVQSGFPSRSRSSATPPTPARCWAKIRCAPTTPDSRSLAPDTRNTDAVVQSRRVRHAGRFHAMATSDATLSTDRACRRWIWRWCAPSRFDETDALRAARRGFQRLNHSNLARRTAS